MQIIHEIWSVTSLELPVNVFFETPTIRRMAAAMHDGSAFVAPDLIRLRDGDESAPLFLFPGGAGNIGHLTDLVRALDYPGVVYGIALSGLDGAEPLPERIEQEATRAMKIIQGVQASGPFRLIGYSMGGITALETARLLRRAHGDTVFLSLIDAPLNDHCWPYTVWSAFLMRKLARKLPNLIKRFLDKRTAARPAIPVSDVGQRRRGTQLEYRFRDPRNPDYPLYSPYWEDQHPPNHARVGANAIRMKGFYKPSRYDGKVYFFASTGGDPHSCDPQQIWPKYLPNTEWIRMPGHHLSIMLGRKARSLAKELSERLKQSMS
jgi:thioesterase domain-containing protein